MSVTNLISHVHEITTDFGTKVMIDERTTLSEIQSSVPVFFRIPFGKRETFTMYRGFLIVRNTVQFTGCLPRRRTIVYLYTGDLEGHPETLCVSGGQDLVSIRQAKRLVDAILERGIFSFGMNF